MADSALTPERALDYLQELSADIRSAVVLRGDGQLAAGPSSGATDPDRMRELVIELFEHADAAAEGPGGAAQIEVTLASAAVFAVRERAWTLAVVADRYALPSLMFYDLRSVINDLGPAKL